MSHAAQQSGFRELEQQSRRRLRAQASDLAVADLIDAFRADPTAQPAEDLRRLLSYFGNLPTPGGYVVERDTAGRWYVCRLLGDPPAHAERVTGPLADERDALVDVFDRRLVDLLGVDSEVGHE